MLQVGLIGTPLGHSASAAYFGQHHPDCRYRAYEMASLEGLRELVEAEGLDGFNVTIPYKRTIVGLLDAVDDTAACIGAVNCVRVRRVDGRLTLTGYNTDAPAFAETLRPLLRPWHRRALVLGTGGAAHAVGYALQQLGIDYRFVSRHPEAHPNAIGYDQLPTLLSHNNTLTNTQFATPYPSTTPSSPHLSPALPPHTPFTPPSLPNPQLAPQGRRPQFSILINATPVGMWPDINKSPMPDISGIGLQHICYDLIYNPEESRWLREAAARGATTCNGLTMLHRQADLSYTRWTTP